MDPVNQAPEPDALPLADTAVKLAQVELQVKAMKAELVRLLQDVARAESRLDHARTSRLVEVNGQLIVAALTSQADAQAAAHALEVAALSNRLDVLTHLPNRITLLQLRNEARQRGVKGRSTMNKAQLEAALTP